MQMFIGINWQIYYLVEYLLPFVPNIGGCSSHLGCKEFSLAFGSKGGLEDTVNMSDEFANRRFSRAKFSIGWPLTRQ